jgi:hypothetical protein
MQIIDKKFALNSKAFKINKLILLFFVDSLQNSATHVSLDKTKSAKPL